MNLVKIILIERHKKATILYDHLYEIPRIGKSTKISENWEERRTGSDCSNGCRISLWGDEAVVELDNGDACSILWCVKYQEWWIWC